MQTVKIPTWLKEYIETNGNQISAYDFGALKEDELEVVTLKNLPNEFIGIASDEDEGGLAVAMSGDGVIYRFEGGELDVYALDESEFVLSTRRDDAWNELSENMPASHAFWLGIVIKTRKPDGTLLTLGFKGEARLAAMVMRGRVEEDDMLADALTRDLSAGLDIDEYEIVDLVDDGGVVEEGDYREPIFTVVVEVEYFDPLDKIGDPSIGWIDLTAPVKPLN